MLLIFYAILGVLLFSGRLAACYQNADDSFIRDSFINVPHAIVALYVLGTTENYPEIM